LILSRRRLAFLFLAALVALLPCLGGGAEARVRKSAPDAKGKAGTEGHDLSAKPMQGAFLRPAAPDSLPPLLISPAPTLACLRGGGGLGLGLEMERVSPPSAESAPSNPRAPPIL